MFSPFSSGGQLQRPSALFFRFLPNVLAEDLGYLRRVGLNVASQIFQTPTVCYAYKIESKLIGRGGDTFSAKFFRQIYLRILGCVFFSAAR